MHCRVMVLLKNYSHDGVWSLVVAGEALCITKSSVATLVTMKCPEKSAKGHLASVNYNFISFFQRDYSS